MSLPGIFTPVRPENQILADGGLLHNLPVDVAKDMGAEVTLAIHLETAPLKPDAQLSLFGVLARSISTTIASNELRSMELADIVVAVPLDAFSSTDYNRADEIIKAGYDAAANKAAILSTLAVDTATWQQYLANREARQRSAPIPKFVAVTGTGPRLAQGHRARHGRCKGKFSRCCQNAEKDPIPTGSGPLQQLVVQMTER